MAKEHLTEVDYIRVILIFTLVGFHAFAPFCGAWPPISDTQIPTYWWVGKFYYSFMLEAFVFISGYVFGFQVRQKGAQLLSMNAIVRSKLKRLLLPSIVFSIIYLLIFGLKDGESIAQACYSIIDGRGHMWFLPMLFWCFIYIAFVEKFDFRTRTVVIAAFTCSFLSFLPLPFRMGSALYYFPFFYVGYAIRHKELKISNIAPPQKKQKHTNNQRFIHYKFLCFNMDSNHVFCRFKNLQYTNSAVQTYLFYVWRCNDLRYLQTAFNERKYSTNNS